MEINRFTLSNGLRVIHIPFTATPMVAVNVVYRVGSRFENPDHTGMAHLFEHLMFGGSANIPDFDGQLQRAGGTSNAWTSFDYTNFYDFLPAQNLATALWIESDRMLSLAFSPKSLEVQRQVVIEEFKEVCLNRPYGDLSHALQALAFQYHSYRYPVIGKEFSHIEQVTMDDVRAWHASHYGPANAVLTICGNVSLEEVHSLVNRYFGPIPTRQVPSLPSVVEPIPSAPRFKEMSGDVPYTAITLAYPMAAYGQPDYYAADLISDILANGQSSRFYRELMLGTDLFNSVDASIQGTDDPGLFLITAYLRNEGPVAEAQAIEAIQAQLNRLCDTPASEREIKRCVNRIISNHTFSNLSPLPIAQTVAHAEIHGQNPDELLLPYNSISPESLRQSASSLFNPDHQISLIYRPR